MHVFRQWPAYIAGRIFPALIAFGGIAVYTRLLDPASFGTYALCLSTSLLIGSTGFAWLRVASLRMTGALEPADRPEFLATTAIAFAGTSIVVAATTLLTLSLWDNALPWSSRLLTAAGAVASGWFELNVTIVQARIRLTSYALLQAGRASAALVATLLLIACKLKANALLGGFALGNCAAWGAVALWKPALHGRFRADVFRRLFRFGWPSSVASISSVSIPFQRYVLTAVAGSVAVGTFAAAGDFAQQIVGLLIGTAALAGQPLAFRARDLASHDELTHQMRNNARLVFSVGLVSSAVLIALAGPITHVYFGAKFRAEAPPIIALSAATIFVSGLRSGYFEQAFEIALDTRPIAISTALRTVLAIASSLPLIGRFGAIGAVVATLLAESIGIAVTIVWARRVTEVPVPLRSFAKIGLATLVMVVAIRLVPGRDAPIGLLLAATAGAIGFSASFALLHLGRVRAFIALRTPFAAEAARS